MTDGRAIAMSVDPNVGDDVCTFCVHARFGMEFLTPPICALGFESYFRSPLNLGPIWVSDCKSGKLRPELLASQISPAGRR